MKRLMILSLFFSAPVLAQGGGAGLPLESGRIRGLHHPAITVSDIDATVAFYSKAVPYRVIKRFTVDGARFAGLTARRPKSVEIALIAMPTGFIQLMDFDPGKAAAPNERPVIGPGYTHICFQSPSRDPAVTRFMAAGLKNISRFGKPDGVDIGGYGVRYAYGRDPDGIMIENESLDRPKRSEASWITHIANTVHDRDRMLSFYEKVLGRKPHRMIEQDNRPRLDDVANIDGLSIRGGWINAGRMEIEVWQYVIPQTPAPREDRKLDEIGYNAFALEVTDLKFERKRLRGLGVRLAGKPIELGGWRVQYVRDPEGNLFALQQRMSAPASESVESLPPA